MPTTKGGGLRRNQRLPSSSLSSLMLKLSTRTLSRMRLLFMNLRPHFQKMPHVRARPLVSRVSRWKLASSSREYQLLYLHAFLSPSICVNASFPSRQRYFLSSFLSSLNAARLEASIDGGTFDIPMSAFWRELLANPEFPLGVRHFETPVLGDIYSGCGFYVRPVYEEILSTLIRYFNVPGGLKHYAITGTPGTLCAPLVILHLCRCALAPSFPADQLRLCLRLGQESASRTLRCIYLPLWSDSSPVGPRVALSWFMITLHHSSTWMTKELRDASCGTGVWRRWIIDTSSASRPMPSSSSMARAMRMASSSNPPRACMCYGSRRLVTAPPR